MREKGNDELSALMDGEATKLELHRVLRTIEEDPEQAAKWQRYHLVSAVLKKEVRPGVAQTLAGMDLASRVSAALAEEPVLHKPEPEPVAPAVNSWWRPLANVAIAASVATVVVIGWQQSQTPGTPQAAPAVAHAVQQNVSQPAAVSGAIPVVAGAAVSQYGSQPSAYSAGQTVVQSYGVMPRSVPVPIEYVRTQKLDEQRFNRYLISHSGNAAFATQGGQLPYVRVVTLKPSESVQR